MIAIPISNKAEIIDYMSYIVEQLKSLDCNENFDDFEEIWENVTDYDLILYLMELFIKGDLNATIVHLGPIIDNHQSAISSLARLNELGVITYCGQISSIETKENITFYQRSYLEFYMHVSNDFDPITFSKILYDSGMIVSATMMIPTKHIIDNDDDYYQYDNKYMLFDEKHHGYIEYDHKEYSYPVSQHEENDEITVETNTWSNSFGDSIFIIFDPSEQYCIYSATITSKNWDDTQCDELLIAVLTE